MAKTPPTTILPIINTRPTLIQDLPPQHIPRPGSPNRLIIIGDVHGQLAPLEDLLAKVNFIPHTTDHLIFVGDTINKGPDSPGVVDLAMRYDASAVRGNHEDKVLTSLAERLQRDAAGATPVRADIGVHGVEGEEVDQGTRTALATARGLVDRQLEWLATRPIILRIAIPSGSETKPPKKLLVVHGGLVPRVPLEEQVAWDVMHIRSLTYPSDLAQDQARIEVLKKRRADSPTATPVVEDDDPALVEEMERLRLNDEARRRGNSQPHVDEIQEIPTANEFPNGREGWDEGWNRWMGELPEEERMVVVYGHDAMKGLAVGNLEVEVHEREGKDMVEAGEGENKDKDKNDKKEGEIGEAGHDAEVEEAVEVGDEEKKQDAKNEEKEGKADHGEEHRHERWTYGLDSGAVYGRQLSALIVHVRADGELIMKVVQVQCDKATEPKN